MTTAYHAPAPPAVPGAPKVVPPKREPADVLLTAEITAMERKIDALLREEESFRSAMIDRQVQRLKVEALSAAYKRAREVVRLDAELRGAGQG